MRRPAGHRDKLRRPMLHPRQARAFVPQLLRRLRRLGSGRQLNFSILDVFDRVAGSTAKKSIQSCVSTNSCDGLPYGIGTRDQTFQSTPTDFAQIQGQQIIFNAEHGSVLIVFALKNTFDQLATFGSAGKS